MLLLTSWCTAQRHTFQRAKVTVHHFISMLPSEIFTNAAGPVSCGLRCAAHKPQFTWLWQAGKYGARWMGTIFHGWLVLSVIVWCGFTDSSLSLVMETSYKTSFTRGFFGFETFLKPAAYSPLPTPHYNADLRSAVGKENLVVSNRGEIKNNWNHQLEIVWPFQLTKQNGCTIVLEWSSHLLSGNFQDKPFQLCNRHKSHQHKKIKCMEICLQ